MKVSLKNNCSPRSLAILLGTYVAAISSLSLTLAADQQEPPPNIILCMADDLGWGDTGFKGHPHIKTPNLDLIAKAGARLDRF